MMYFTSIVLLALCWGASTFGSQVEALVQPKHDNNSFLNNVELRALYSKFIKGCWRLHQFKTLSEEKYGHVASLVPGADGALVTIKNSSDSGTRIHIVNTQSNKYSIIKGLKNNYIYAAISPQRSLLALYSNKGHLALWNIEDIQSMRVVSKTFFKYAHSLPVQAMQLRGDNKLILHKKSLQQSDLLEIYDIHLKKIFEKDFGRQKLCASAINNSGQVVAIVIEDGWLYAIDAKTGNKQHNLYSSACIHGYDAQYAFSDTGHQLLVVAWNGAQYMIEWWDLTIGQTAHCVRRCMFHRTRILDRPLRVGLAQDNKAFIVWSDVTVGFEYDSCAEKEFCTWQVELGYFKLLEAFIVTLFGSDIVDCMICDAALRPVVDLLPRCVQQNLLNNQSIVFKKPMNQSL